MRHSFTGWLASASLAALVSSAAVLAQAQTTDPTPTPTMPPGVTVTVTVTVVYNKADKPIGILVSPDPAMMHSYDTLSWDLVSPHTDDMTITMVDGTKPFSKQPKKNNKKNSASDKPTSPDDVYKYLIKVTTESGKVLKLDPIIKITP